MRTIGQRRLGIVVAGALMAGASLAPHVAAQARPVAPARPAAPVLPLAATSRDEAPPAPPPAPLPPSSVPAGFCDELMVGNWDRAMGVTFAADGRAFVWEKSGVIWTVVDGVKSSVPFLDIRPEVGDWQDYGLMSVALDPDFLENGYVYLLYVVDHYYLTHFGLPGYDPAKNEYYQDTIGRVTRYTASAATNFQQALVSSRLVLLGESISTGIPITGTSHGPGTLTFGDDGTLLVTCGDGAVGSSSGTALAEGIVKPKENIGAWRVQLVDSLSGKLLRLDPATGDGVPSNPFYDRTDPRAPRSRAFALGLRQPCRASLRRGSGSTDPADARPGTVFIGDVGAESFEELDVVTHPGVDMGWPLYEGLHPFSIANVLTANQDAPNPLAGQNGCSQTFFNFQDLLVQDTLDTPAWNNPCDPEQPITGVPVFVHHRPALEWSHSFGARVPTYDDSGNATDVSIDDPASPVTGQAFGGNCSIGGCWYDGTSFPDQYRNTYLHGDFGQGWIRDLVFDANDTLLEVRPFAQPVGRVVSLATNPADGSVWYINYTDQGVAQLRRIRYDPLNLPPLAVIQPTPPFGAAPFAVTFDATGSSDPENAPLAIAWDFGDGTPVSHMPVVTHVFPSVDITPLGTIVGQVFTLDPPGSNGFSNPDPNVIRDGDLPPLNTIDKQREYDTMHFLHNGLTDKGPDDWIGYTFASISELRALLFQGGMIFPGGGSFASLSVQAQQNGVWNDIPGVSITPAYPGDLDTHYRTYEINFPPISGRGIRLYGPPQGVSNFITVGELRVTAAPYTPQTASQNFTVTLTVTDPAGASSTASRVVTINDTPPQATIVSPGEFLTYDPAAPSPLDVVGLPSDAEQPPDQLACSWQANHCHNDHVHPGPVVDGCTQQVELAADGCDGDLHWIELVYTVTDPFGLSATAKRHLVPVCDRNLNGIPDADEIAAGTSLDSNRNGIPDEAETDCNGNGLPDLLEVFFQQVADINHNGVPDSCDYGLNPPSKPVGATATKPR